MIDPQILKITDERIKIEIEQQNQHLRDEIKRVSAEMAARGLGHSGAMIGSISKLYKQYIKNQAHLIWQTLFRFITTSGISYSESLASDLKEIVSKYLPESFPDFKNYILKSASHFGSDNIYNEVESDLASTRGHTLRLIGTEIDLFVYSLREKSKIKESDNKSTILNIYSPVGSIQTGDNAMANIIQNIDTDLKLQLDDTLKVIADGLEQLDALPAHQKHEINDIVSEGREELKKDKPNSLKLKSLLTTIGTTIQTVASMKPAYDTLKQLLTYFGVSLP